MVSHTVTLDLREEVYEQAERVAQMSDLPVEQVIASWITPPHPSLGDIIDEIARLDQLDDDELTQLARSVMPQEDLARLAELLALQRDRNLSEEQRREAAALVEKEDWYTLRRARALYLLKRRNALPDDLGELLDSRGNGIHPAWSPS